MLINMTHHGRPFLHPSAKRKATGVLLHPSTSEALIALSASLKLSKGKVIDLAINNLLTFNQGKS